MWAEKVLNFIYLFLACIYPRSSSCLLMIYFCFCLQFYRTFTLPFKLTKIVMVLCLIFVTVSTAMRLLMWYILFLILSDFCLAHVLYVCVCVCVCLGYCSHLVLWLLLLALCVSTARGNCFIGIIFLSCIRCRILTLDVIMLSGGTDVWFNTQPFFLRAQTTNDVVLEAVTVTIRIEFQWDCLRFWAGDAFCPKVGKYVICWHTRVLQRF